MTTAFGKREKFRITLTTFQNDLELARKFYKQAEYLKSFDLYEQLAAAYPDDLSIPLLAELYEQYRVLPQRDRYSLYQSRHFNFGIKPGDKVLDVGSGHIPFPLATHLSDITLSNHGFGRAGVPFRYVADKPVFECNVEDMPFADKEFDFVYCSHVLEHAVDPLKACRELMRVAKRGFIECPSPGKDIFLNSAKVSNHTWGVESFDNKLIFFEYTPEQIEAFQCDILQQMHGTPLTEREKAFSALIYLKADVVNTMLLWENGFDCEIRRISAPWTATWSSSEKESAKPLVTTSNSTVQPNNNEPKKPLRFVQVHTFYQTYINDLYSRNPGLNQATFNDQIKALIADGFSGIHMFAPYMPSPEYDTQLIIANNPYSQEQWLRENQGALEEPGNWMYEVVRKQIESINPDVLYLTDPITFNTRFIKTLSVKPSLILGWRAANIPENTDWSSFDVLMSSLSSLRQVALGLGARHAEAFFPGFPVWINDVIRQEPPVFDVVFSGSWTWEQHPSRNRYLQILAEAAGSQDSFSLGLYLSGDTGSITPDVARYNQGPKFGIDMYAALKSGRIVLDARGILEIKNSTTGQVTDLAGQQTANMRIFEVTGCGGFLLAEHYDNISDYFEPGVEIETFRNSSEMLEKIKYYLAHPLEREAIARRGQERCLRDYSMERRAAALDEIVRKHISLKSNVQPEDSPAFTDSSRQKQATSQEPTAASQAVLDLAAQAEALLLRDDTQKAFSVLIEAKKLKIPFEGLDYLRALCFLRMGQRDGALESLREELRWFPENFKAQELLDQLQASAPVCGQRNEDAEFQRILREIRPYTMLSEARLYSLFRLAKEVCSRNIPGNFVECGVAAGGSSALLAYVIKTYSRQPRRLFSFDSFSGMPEPTAEDTAQGIAADDSGWGTGTCSAPEESVMEICTKLGVADMITPVKGYFEDTLPDWKNRIGVISLLHLDGDWYKSTRDILDNLYDQVVDQGFLQADDYGHWEGCKKAVHEFEADRGFRFSLNPIDGTGVWFTKPDRLRLNPDIPSEMVEEFFKDDPAVQGIDCQMSINERFQLYHLARNSAKVHLHQPSRFIEIGSFAGGSLSLIANAFKRNNRLFQGIAIEPNPTHSFLDVAQSLRNDVIHIAATSQEAAPRISLLCSEEKGPVLIFIDGDHNYKAVREDIENYYPLLAPGGVIVFHDWLPELDEKNRESILFHHGGKEPGVRDACRELLEERFGCTPLPLPLLYPDDPAQTQSFLPIIPGVKSTLRAYRKPVSISLEQAFTDESKRVLEASGALDRMRQQDGRLRPLTLFCETVNICNSDCVMCPYSQQTRPRGTMSDVLFRKVLQQYAEIGGGCLSLTPMVGDILLDQLLPQRLSLLQTVGDLIIPSVTSNLYALGSWSDDVVAEMLQTFKMIHVSCYGISQQENRTITRRDHYDTFLVQMRRLLRLKYECAGSAEITIGFRVLHEYTQEQIQDFQMRAFGQTVKTTGVCSMFSNWGNTMSCQLPGQARFIQGVTNTMPCIFLSMAMMIFWDGKVSACACCDFDGNPDLSLGEFGQSSLIELFNSSANRRLWEGHQQGRLPAYCRECSFHAPLCSLTAGHPLLSDIYSFIGG